jgi:hypothetical protein
VHSVRPSEHEGSFGRYDGLQGGWRAHQAVVVRGETVVKGLGVVGANRVDLAFPFVDLIHSLGLF